MTAPIAISNTGRTTIVTADPHVPLMRVYKLLVTADSATTIAFEDAGGTVYSGTFDIPANGSICLAQDAHAGLQPWFSTDGSLVVNQSGSAHIGGIVCYTRG